jgi:hypothetical protein
MATKNAKANRANGTKAAAKAGMKASLLHIAMAGSKKTLCGARGKAAPAAEATCAECRRAADHAAAKLLEAAEGAAAASAHEPATAAAGATAAGNTNGAATKRQKANVAATKDSTGPVERDPRLPPVGTVVRKLDRHGAARCECKVVEGGFEYKGEFFKSLSGAACAAAKDLGIHGQVNGFVFWGIVKEPRAKNPVQAIEKVWERYSARVKALAGAGLDAGTRKQVAELLEDHRTKIAEAPYPSRVGAGPSPIQRPSDLTASGPRERRDTRAAEEREPRGHAPAGPS